MGADLDAEVEADVKAKGLTAPRLTSMDLDAAITTERYWQPAGTTVTVCCLTLRNGYSVIGESAAVSPENFDAEIGRKVARAGARDKIWALEGYLLKQRLFEQGV
jgi:Phage protein (N4 Gp49/phage Sf6 gene 66) family